MGEENPGGAKTRSQKRKEGKYFCDCEGMSWPHDGSSQLGKEQGVQGDEQQGLLVTTS